MNSIQVFNVDERMGDVCDVCDERMGNVCVCDERMGNVCDVCGNHSPYDGGTISNIEMHGRHMLADFVCRVCSDTLILTPDLAPHPARWPTRPVRSGS